MIGVDVPGWVLLAAAFAVGVGLWGGVIQHGHTSIVDGGTLSPSSTVPMVPTGTLLPYGGNAAPAGYLGCDGSAVDRTTYAALFAVLGTSYGPGDGVTTFNVPDLRGRSPLGSGAGAGLTARIIGQTGGEENHALTANENGQHSHTATVTDPGHAHPIGSENTANATGGAGSFFRGNDTPTGTQNLGTATDPTGITVSNANSGLGTAHNTMHPFAVCNFIIKT